MLLNCHAILDSHGGMASFGHPCTCDNRIRVSPGCSKLQEALAQKAW
jgi:hypothetical protein